MLGFTRNDESDTVGVIDDGVGESDSLGRRFGGITEMSDPSIGFGQEFMPGEKGTGVAIWTHAEQDQVEYWEPGGIHLGKRADELFLVFVREFVKVVEKGFVDGMDLRSRDGDMGEESLITGFKVGILMVERYYTFITEEDFPAKE